MNPKWKPKMINCADCGAETLATHNKTKFCPECAEKREKNRLAELAKKQALKRKDEKPVEPDEREIHFCDSLENVKMCLNCEKPVCTNCLFYGTNAKKKARKRYVPEDMKERVVSLVNQKVPQWKIAEMVGVSPSTVSKWIAGLRWEGLL